MSCTGENVGRPAGFTQKLDRPGLKKIKGQRRFFYFSGDEELDARYRLLLGLLL
jgi:hypothetical protein